MINGITPNSTLFPYTTLFRSFGQRADLGRHQVELRPAVNHAVHQRRRRPGTERSLARRRERQDRPQAEDVAGRPDLDRKSTRLNSSHVEISYAVFCLKKKTEQ